MTPFHMCFQAGCIFFAFVLASIVGCLGKDVTSGGNKNIAKWLFLPILSEKECRLCYDCSFSSTCGVNFGTVSFPSLLHCYLIFRFELWTWLQTPSLINYANYWNPYLYRHNSQGSLSYACLQEIRPTPSKDPPMMQIVSILILQPATLSCSHHHLPSTALFSTLLLVCSPHVVCSLHTLIFPKHNLKGSHFKSGVAVKRSDATKKMILNPRRAGRCLSTYLHMQHISLDLLMTCICMQFYHLFLDSPSRYMQAVQHKEARGRPAINTQVLW